MLTIPEFAKKHNKSKPIIDSWIYRYGLPVIQIGRRVYIEESDYQDWINNHRKVSENRSSKNVIELELPVKERKSRIAGKIKKIY